MLSHFKGQGVTVSGLQRLDFEKYNCCICYPTTRDQGITITGLQRLGFKKHTYKYYNRIGSVSVRCSASSKGMSKPQIKIIP